MLATDRYGANHSTYSNLRYPAIVLAGLGAIRSMERVVGVSNRLSWTGWGVATASMVSLTGLIAGFGEAAVAESAAVLVATGWAFAKQDAAVKKAAAVAEINWDLFILFLLGGS